MEDILSHKWSLALLDYKLTERSWNLFDWEVNPFISSLLMMTVRYLLGMEEAPLHNNEMSLNRNRLNSDFRYKDTEVITHFDSILCVIYPFFDFHAIFYEIEIMNI